MAKDKGFRDELDITASDKPSIAPAGDGAELHTTGPAWKPGDSVESVDTPKAPRGGK